MTDLDQLREQANQDFANGDYEELLVKLRQVEDRSGLDAELANDQAVALYKLGRVPESLEMFKRSAEMGGEQMVAWNALDLLADRAAVPGPGSNASAATAMGTAGQGPTSGFDDLGQQVVAAALNMWQANSADALHKAAAPLTDEEWAQVLCASVDGRPFAGFLLPGFIDEELQREFVGSSGVNALVEGYRFVRVVLHYMAEHGVAFGPETKVADFGSGWGRYTRFMLKYVHPDNLYGLEVSSEMVEHCRKSFGMANFIKVPTFPPCDLRDDLLDLVFGYSVFSHLSPDCADAWIAEFARITKPGALVLMTTQGRSFIDYCREVRESGNRSHSWFVGLSEAFVDVEKAHAEYDAGGFLHFGYGQYQGTYGESLVSRGYVEKNWTEHFELIDFVDDRNFMPQALMVLRRR